MRPIQASPVPSNDPPDRDDLENRQRLESLGLVAGGIAHDFNNLLVGVLAEASAAREDRDLSESTREALRRIESAARRMAQLTRELLAFAGRAQVITYPIDADGLVAEHHEALARQVRPELRLTVSIGGKQGGVGSVVVEGDRGWLRQVISNLVENASDAASSRIEVITQVIARDSGPHWQLEVADDGSGIDPSALPRIFEPFFSTKSGHHGLGLSAVHGIVRRLGGDVEVETKPGVGTRIRVRLPITTGVEAPRTTTPDQVPATTPLEGICALVADDEPSVRATVRRLLERRGATVVVASDGLDAEAKLRSQGAAFQLVITDVAMPGATGHDVLDCARDVQPGARVILMSGYTEKLREPGSEHVPDAFLEKPFTAKALDRVVDEILRKSAPK
jgi:two-component system cell cycle sensor histidine kinase/response regulator CckA